MSNITRRKSWAFLAGAPVAGWLVGKELQGSASALASEDHWKQIDPRENIRQRYFPNVTLTTHENKQVRLYDDLVKDKVMLINFMYTSCERLCPRVTQNLVKVQKLLGDRMGHDVFFYSFSLDPKNDKPEVLKDYAATHKVGPGWSFLTGAADDLEMLRRILGFTDPDPEQDKDRDSHIGNVRYGNEPRQLWGACPGMSHADFIVEAIGWVDWPQGQKPKA